MNTIVAFIAALVLNSSYPASEAKNINTNEIKCIATAVYSEARGEPIEGQIAVAHVILNRQKSGHYPDTACGVVYQASQFTDVHLVKIDDKSKQWQQAVEVSVLSYIGFLDDPTKGSKWFYNPKKCSPKWAKRKTLMVQIGNHNFMSKSIDNLNKAL